MALLHAKKQDFKQCSVHTTALHTRGWLSLLTSLLGELNFREKLIELASELGTPVATRSGGAILDTLVPTKANSAKRKSLSKIHDVGEFPLHMDTAHWLKPCRYLVLGCVNPGSSNRPTILLDAKRIPLTNFQKLLLHSAPLRVTNGRNSFFSTILSKTRPFIRFDQACMTAVTAEGTEAMEIFSRHNWPDYIETAHWTPGMVLVIDNWRILHARAHSDRSDLDRKLIRVSVL